MLLCAPLPLAIPALIGIWLLVLRRDRRVAFRGRVLVILLTAMTLSFNTFVDYAVFSTIAVPLLGGDGVSFGLRGFWITWGMLLYLLWPVALGVILWRKGIVELPGGIVSDVKIHRIHFSRRAKWGLKGPLIASAVLMVPALFLDALVPEVLPGALRDTTAMPQGIQDRAAAVSPDKRLSVHFAKNGWLDEGGMRLTCESGFLPVVHHDLVGLTGYETYEAQGGQPMIVWSVDSALVFLFLDHRPIVGYDFSTQSALRRADPVPSGSGESQGVVLDRAARFAARVQSLLDEHGGRCPACSSGSR